MGLISIPSYHCKEINLRGSSLWRAVVLAASRACAAVENGRRLLAPRVGLHQRINQCGPKRMGLAAPLHSPPPCQASISRGAGDGHFAKVKRGPRFLPARAPSRRHLCARRRNCDRGGVIGGPQAWRFGAGIWPTALTTPTLGIRVDCVVHHIHLRHAFELFLYN